MKINLKYILIVVAIVVVAYYILSKKEGCCGNSSNINPRDSNHGCPVGTKWNPQSQFCETPKSCQNTCFMSKEAHVASQCPDDSNLGDCLNAWCAKKCA